MKGHWKFPRPIDWEMDWGQSKRHQSFHGLWGCVWLIYFSGIHTKVSTVELSTRWFGTDDKRKAVLIRGLETPFWNANYSAIWHAFEPETRFCRHKCNLVMKRVLLYPTFLRNEVPLYCTICGCHGWNYAMQLPQWLGLPLDSAHSSKLASAFDTESYQYSGTSL